MYAALSPPFGFYPATDEGSTGPQPYGGQFWDGRAANLSDQVTEPLLNPTEMNNGSTAAVIAKIRAAPYAALFQLVCGADAFKRIDSAFNCLSDSVAAFEQSPELLPFTSKFDLF